MFDLSLLEASFQEYSKNLHAWAPDGVQEVDLPMLQRLDLLNVLEDTDPLPALTRRFQVIESPSKITLVNDQFAVWIVPEMVDGEAITYSFIALNNPIFPTLELVFCTKGVYNTSRLVLRILEKVLVEIQENEELLEGYRGAPS